MSISDAKTGTRHLRSIDITSPDANEQPKTLAAEVGEVLGGSRFDEAISA
jgi:hypothetical protein